jgi:hypothetical protein
MDTPMGEKARFLKSCVNELFPQTESSFVKEILNLWLILPFVLQTQTIQGCTE